MALADANYRAVIMSHRSGETEDTTVADLAVATGVRSDQGRRAVPHRPHGKVQPGSSASRKGWTTPPATPAARCSAAFDRAGVSLCPH